MKNRIRILWLVMSALIFSGCGGKAEIAPSQPPGTLAAIDYSRTVGMVWGENFSVRVSPEEIVYIEFFVENDSEYRIETGIPLEEDRWQQLETAVLALWPDLTEVRPEKESLWKRFFKKEEPFLLDGGDSSSLTLEWETEDGTVSAAYTWKNDDPKAWHLIDLLHALPEYRKGE